MRTVDQVIATLSSQPSRMLKAPSYRRDDETEVSQAPRVGLAVESMRRHSTDEGWQLFDGLQSAGWELSGFNLPTPLTNVSAILETLKPGVVLMQDKREWDGLTAGGVKTFDARERFSSVEVLADRPDIFKLTVLKDAHQQGEYHRQSAFEIGCHAWVIYYHPRIVASLAPWVRPQHLVRTWHSVNPAVVPAFDAFLREGAVVCGALNSRVYPLRTRLSIAARSNKIPDLRVLPHPGYHRRGSETPSFLRELSKAKVAICTSSIYGYALRKIVEATAAGCVVITDLPEDDVMPEIDGNLIRVMPNFTDESIRFKIEDAIVDYNQGRQRMFAEKANAWYDFKATGLRLARDIEDVRRSYAS